MGGEEEEDVKGGVRGGEQNSRGLEAVVVMTPAINDTARWRPKPSLMLRTFMHRLCLIESYDPS